MSGDEPLSGRLLDTARAALWAGLRLVVIDLETCLPPGRGRPRAVAVAAVSCRAGSQRGAWSTLIDPECPIDATTGRIHGITDELVAGQPTFAEVAPQLVNLLEPRDDEQVLLVAHNVRSDVAVLRAEFDRVGETLPELPVLDTMGRLPQTVGVRPASRALADLAHLLGVVNHRPHDALADAQTCAECLVRLLDLGARRGLDDFGPLLADVSRGARTTTIEPARRTRARRTAASGPTVSADHVATHARVLDARVRERGLARWAAEVTECCTLRCPSLVERVEQAGPSPARLLPVLDTVLADLSAQQDTPGVATLLPALLPVVTQVPTRKGRSAMRETVLAWATAHGPTLDILGHCGNDDRCPTCRAGDPCPLDTWRDVLAPTALGDPAATARSFLRPNGSQAGTGAYTSWIGRGLDRGLADAVVAVVVQHWREHNQPGWADTVAGFAWDARCRHPEVAIPVATVRSAPGTPDDLEAALAILTQAQTTDSGSTADPLRRLGAYAAQLSGRLRQARSGRPTGRFDEDGNPIYAAPHRPTNPKRTRPRRFAETIPGGASPAAREDESV